MDKVLCFTKILSYHKIQDQSLKQLHIQEIFYKEADRVKVKWYGQMEAFLMAYGKMIKDKEEK